MSEFIKQMDTGHLARDFRDAADFVREMDQLRDSNYALQERVLELTAALDRRNADKAELLEELKRLHAYAKEHCLHRGLLNASAIIAKHEERK
jgi:hypothetical protein